MYSSYVEYQVRDAVTDMVVHQGNANNTVPNVLHMGACPFCYIEGTPNRVLLVFLLKRSRVQSPRTLLVARLGP